MASTKVRVPEEIVCEEPAGAWVEETLPDAQRYERIVTTRNGKPVRLSFPQINGMSNPRPFKDMQEAATRIFPDVPFEHLHVAILRVDHDFFCVCLTPTKSY